MRHDMRKDRAAKCDPAIAAELLDDGWTVSAVARHLGVSEQYVRNYSVTARDDAASASRKGEAACAAHLDDLKLAYPAEWQRLQAVAMA